MGENLSHQLVFDLSEEQINELVSRPVPVREVSEDLWNIYQLSDKLTPAEIAVCDQLHDLDESDEALKGFLRETPEMRNRYSAMGEIAVPHLIKKYSPSEVAVDEPAPVILRAMTEQVVLRKISNKSNSAKPKIVRLRTRRQPNQVFRSR
jgi:hypothetical protein